MSAVKQLTQDQLRVQITDMHTCVICASSFKNRQSIYLHMNKVHGIRFRQTDYRCCSGCKIELNDENWHKTARRGNRYLCVKCQNARTNANSRACRRKTKLEMILAYGGQCQCCGERTPEFLTIDHIFNDGARDREKFGHYAKNRPRPSSGSAFFYYLKRNGWPKDRFQLLCFNCNCGKFVALDKICPHKREAICERRAG